MRRTIQRPSCVPWLKPGSWALLGGLWCSACGGAPPADAPATPPQTRNVVHISGYAPLEIFNEPGTAARTVPFGVDAVWSVLPAILEGMGIPPEHLDPRGRTIGNPGFRVRRIDGSLPNAFIDCGTSFSGPLANNYDVTLTVFTTLRPLASDSTVVQTTVDANAKARAVSGNPVHCQSRGELELRVAQKVMEALVSGS